MNLTLLGPAQKTVYSILWLEVETSLGNFVIQEGHAPILLILKPNTDILISLTNGHSERIGIPGGILEVTRTDALLLLNE